MVTSSRFFAPKGTSRRVTQRNQAGLLRKDAEVWESPVGLTVDAAIELSDDDDDDNGDDDDEEHVGSDNDVVAVIDGDGGNGSGNIGVMDDGPSLPTDASHCVCTYGAPCGGDDNGAIPPETRDSAAAAVLPRTTYSVDSGICRESILASSSSTGISVAIQTEVREHIEAAPPVVSMDLTNSGSIPHGSDGASSSDHVSVVLDGGSSAAASPTLQDAENPFAMFAYQSDDAKETPPSIFPRELAKRSKKVHQRKNPPPNRDGKTSKRSRPSKPSCSSKDNSFAPITSLSKENRDTILKKWQSLADPHASLEVRRFQVLVAARLHAQCHQPMVKKAMDNLRCYFRDNCGDGDGGEKSNDGDKTNVEEGSSKPQHGSSGTLCAQTLAKADPNELATHCLSSVLFANVKARHIVQASKDVLSRFNGVVPESRSGLKELMGIGPKLADILSFVNTRKACTLSVCEANDGCGE